MSQLNHVVQTPSNITRLSINHDKKWEVVRKTLCKDASDEDLQLFSHICERTGLDPFTRQIYLMPRREKGENGHWITKHMALVSIDGLRLVAERTGRYAPGREATFQYGENKDLISATSYIKKMTADGTWHEVSATAHYSEYLQTKKDRETNKESPTTFWKKMPHIMLAKCAEALALRRAFPAELSGVYTTEEVSNEEITHIPEKYLSQEEIGSILQLCKSDDERIKKMLNAYEVSSLNEIKSCEYPVIIRRLQKGNREEVEHAKTGS